MKIKSALTTVLLSTLAACGGGGSSTSAPAASSTSGVTTTVTGASTPQLEMTATALSDSIQVGASYWPADAGNTSTGGAAIDGVSCIVNESYHIHVHLTIIKDGTALAIPANIGLNSADKGCAYETHTHSTSGIIHIETNAQKNFTLGQFFAVWGKPLTATSLAGFTGETISAYVSDGATVNTVIGDLATLPLVAHQDIILVIGAKPQTVPKYAWAAGL